MSEDSYGMTAANNANEGSNVSCEIVIPTPIYDSIKSEAEVYDRLSSYKSDFDYTIYRDLELRYREPELRGGFLFKTPLKVLNHHSSCSKCHYTFELDTYGRGCFHNCTYCYAMEQLTSHGWWNRPQPFPININELRKAFYTVFETDKPSKWREVMSKRIPLRIGSMSDSFMKMDIKYGVTKETLKILSHYDYPYVIFTRSDVVARDEYMRELRPDLCSVQFSISGNNEKLSRLIEPGAPSYNARMTALKKLSAAGFWTTVRINPFFPMHPDGYFTDPDSIVARFGKAEDAPKFDFFSWEMLDDLKAAGVPSFLIGVVRLSPAGLRNMAKATGLPLQSFFKNQGATKSHDLRYSDQEVAHYYRMFHREARKRGLRFSTCFIGMGLKDYFEYQDLWANKSDCCDARGNVDAIKASSQDISWSERIKHAPNKAHAFEAEKAEIATEAFYADKAVSKHGPLGIVPSL